LTGRNVLDFEASRVRGFWRAWNWRAGLIWLGGATWDRSRLNLGLTGKKESSQIARGHENPLRTHCLKKEWWKGEVATILPERLTGKGAACFVECES